jgi:hypothetical protein
MISHVAFWNRNIVTCTPWSRRYLVTCKP